MISKAQVMCKVIEATLLYQIFVFYRKFTMLFWHKIFFVSSFLLKFGDVTVTLFLIILPFFFC